jgi:hypothetical protein
MVAPVELEIRNAEDFARLAKRLREAGDAGKGLRKELSKGLNQAAKPAKAAIKPSVRARLPHRGGLAGTIASTISVRQSNISAGRNPRVRIVVRGTHNIDALDKGHVRHPVFGDRSVWREESVPPRAFTDPVAQRAPQMRQEMSEAIRSVAKKIEGH